MTFAVPKLGIVTLLVTGLTAVGAGALALACSGSVAPATSGGPGPGDPGGGPTPASARYSGKGFVVHEWGTNTVVVGSDGSLQRGLHHEEEGLPAFVYDRIKGATRDGEPVSAEIKMETPVTYFYSDKPLTVRAKVAFPRGVFTQWYPAVRSFAPLVAWKGAVNGRIPEQVRDPVLDVAFPFQAQVCRDKYTPIANGLLDWGSIEILPRGSNASSSFPQASLDHFSWSYARQVDSNAIRTSSGEAEQFLFYRGLANADLPVKVTAQSGGRVALRNGGAESMGAVFVLDVGATKGAFVAHPEGIAAGATLADTAPSLDDARAQPMDAYADALGLAVTKALDATGLYHDESVAMVNTWKRQWFRTPGVRVLYLVPESWTDAAIPLTIDPKPETMTRMMLIRVEVITPELEALDAEAARKLDSKDDLPVAQAYFSALGRFGEPRLRRAIALVGQAPGAQAYLSLIATASTTVSSGE